MVENGERADRVSMGDLMREFLSRAAELMGVRLGDGAELMLDLVDGRFCVLSVRVMGGVLCLGLGVGFWTGLRVGLEASPVGFVLIISHSRSCSFSAEIFVCLSFCRRCSSLVESIDTVDRIDETEFLV